MLKQTDLATREKQLCAFDIDFDILISNFGCRFQISCGGVIKDVRDNLYSLKICMLKIFPQATAYLF